MTWLICNLLSPQALLGDRTPEAQQFLTSLGSHTRFRGSLRLLCQSWLAAVNKAGQEQPSLPRFKSALMDAWWHCPGLSAGARCHRLRGFVATPVTGGAKSGIHTQALDSEHRLVLPEAASVTPTRARTAGLLEASQEAEREVHGPALNDWFAESVESTRLCELMSCCGLA